MRKSITTHLVMQVNNPEDEEPVRAFLKKSAAKEYADLRIRTERAVGGRRWFRVVTVPLILDPSSPAASGGLRPDMEAVE